MLSISFNGLDRFYNINREKILQITHEAFTHGRFIDGPRTSTLEKNLANLSQRKHAVCTGSGTDALFFALKACQIGCSDEVLVPAISYVATAGAVLCVGAIPLFVDVNPNNGIVDLNDARLKITTKTRAIIVVNLYGNMPNTEELDLFVDEHQLILIEDAAQAIGSERNGYKAGSLGKVSIFSFDPTKPIGAFGTGGAILTNNEAIAHSCRKYRNNGKNSETGDFDSFGINSRMSEMQAGLVNWQLEELGANIAQRQIYAHIYFNELSKCSDRISFISDNTHINNFHKFVIATERRNNLIKFLFENGIECKIHYDTCLYRHAYLGKYASVCPSAEDLCNNVISLPLYNELQPDEIGYICNTVIRFFK